MNRNDKEFIAQRIRTQYTEKQATELDSLRALDAKVKRPANVFAYLFGSVSALVLGFGMCLAMKVLFDMMAVGIVIGIVGIAMCLITYPIYKKILNSAKKKNADKINELANEILNA